MQLSIRGLERGGGSYWKSLACLCSKLNQYYPPHHSRLVVLILLIVVITLIFRPVLLWIPAEAAYCSSPKALRSAAAPTKTNDETLPEISHLIRQRSQIYPLAVLPPTKRIGETDWVVNEEAEWTWQEDGNVNGPDPLWTERPTGPAGQRWKLPSICQLWIALHTPGQRFDWLAPFQI